MRCNVISDLCCLGNPCPSLYIMKRHSYKQSILFGTIFFSLTVYADQCRAPHIFILWAEPLLMVRSMSTHEGIRVYTPTVRDSIASTGPHRAAVRSRSRPTPSCAPPVQLAARRSRPRGEEPRLFASGFTLGKCQVNYAKLFEMTYF